MPWTEDLPEWSNTGIEPASGKKTSGWTVGEKPPAEYLNWLFNRAYKCLEELRSAVDANGSSGILKSLFTARGMFIRSSAANTPEAVELGTAGKSIVSDGTDIVYDYPYPTTMVASNTTILSATTERSTTPSVNGCNPHYKITDDDGDLLYDSGMLAPIATYTTYSHDVIVANAHTNGINIYIKANASESFELKKQFLVACKGTYRVVFDLVCQNGGSPWTASIKNAYVKADKSISSNSVITN